MTAPTVDIFEKSDPSRNEVSIRAGLEGTGLTVKARSQAVSALDRLVGSALDIPGIWLEHRAERARLIAISEQEAMKRDAIDFLEDRNLNVNRVLIWLGDKDNVRRIENRSAVAVVAIDDLQNACPTQDNKLSNNNGEDWEVG